MEINSSIGWYYFSRRAEIFALLVYNFYGCVSKTMKLSRPVGVFVVVVLVGLEVVVKVGGGGA